MSGAPGKSLDTSIMADHNMAHHCRYSIPVYCLSNPLNLVLESDRDSPADFSEPVLAPDTASSGQTLSQGEELKVKVRLSTTGEDIRLVLNTLETVGMAKRKLQEQEGCQEPSRQRWYFGGKLLGDKSRVGEAHIPQGYVVQCIINTLDFDVNASKE